MFYISVSICTLFVLGGVLFTETLATIAATGLDFVTSTFGWVYLVATFGFFLVMIFLIFSRYGKIRLGRDDERPEFSTRAWLSMMLAAVMGIGLIAFGVAEPISHFAVPPHGLAEPQSEEAAVLAMQYSFFDWGLHAWALFGLVGIALAYSMYRKGRKALISQIFYPVLGERVNGPIGKAIDILAIFATLFGTATSLGLGAIQINGGLSSVFGVANAVPVQVGIIIVITLLFVMSAVSGVHRGIRYLSEINMVLAGLMVLFLLVVGPTLFILNLYVESLGAYASNFVRMSFRSTAFADMAWMQGWTLFMLTWWISWGAFVGLFIARISRGRTIREVALTVLIVPTLVFSFWFTVMGGTAIYLDLYQGANIAEVTSENLNNAVFATLGAFPLATVTSLLAIVLTAIFFITGADSNTLVLSILSSDGNDRPKAPVFLIWGALTALAAAILLLADGLAALQQLVIITAAPFMVIVIGLVYAFFKDLRSELPAEAPRREPVMPAEREWSASQPPDVAKTQ